MFEQVELLDEKLPAGPAGPSAFLAWLPVLGGTVVPSSMFPRFAKTSLRLAVGAVMNLIYIYIYTVPHCAGTRVFGKRGRNVR